MSDPVVGRASPFKARGPFRGIRAPFRGIGVWGRYGPRTNSIRNSTMQGAVAGSPGTQPTNWVGWTSLASGLQFSIAGTGIEDGMTYVDIRIAGTSSNTTGINNFFELATQIVASLNQTWTGSGFVRIVAGSLGNLVVQAGIYERTAAGSGLGQTTRSLWNTDAVSLARGHFTVTRTMSNASVARVVSGIRIAGDGSSAYDVTLRIAAPQLERGIGAAAFIATSGAAASSVADSLVGAY